MREWLDEFWFLALSIALFIAASIGMLYVPMPVTAASDPVDACVPMGTAEGQTLFFCENPFSGMDCVWDPSPVLGAGVMDCD